MCKGYRLESYHESYPLLPRELDVSVTLVTDIRRVGHVARVTLHSVVTIQKQNPFFDFRLLDCSTEALFTNQFKQILRFLLYFSTSLTWLHLFLFNTVGIRKPDIRISETFENQTFSTFGFQMVENVWFSNGIRNPDHLQSNLLATIWKPNMDLHCISFDQL